MFGTSKKDDKSKKVDEGSEIGSIAPSHGRGSDDMGDDRRVFQDDWEQRRSGAIYRGEIVETNKRPDGKGIKVHGKKSLYEGYWSDGKCHGYGRGINSAGEVYQGQFNNDTMEGKGFYYWPDGRIYEGTFVEGKKQGKGRFFWRNGQVYDGEFKNDECNGNGTLFYPDGKRFEGQWRDGSKHGKGSYIFPNG